MFVKAYTVFVIKKRFMVSWYFYVIKMGSGDKTGRARQCT
jgi:hypothetical protein